jgi:hypothetical protein
MLAYRRQQPPQQAGLLSRWLIAHWATQFTEVWVADWDESNAYCNIPRSDLPALLQGLYLRSGATSLEPPPPLPLILQDTSPPLEESCAI